MDAARHTMAGQLGPQVVGGIIHAPMSLGGVVNTTAVSGSASGVFQMQNANLAFQHSGAAPARHVSQPVTMAPGAHGPHAQISSVGGFHQQSTTQSGSMGLMAPKGLPMPAPLHLPDWTICPRPLDDLMVENNQRNAINLMAQADLAAKDKQYEELARYAASLQQAVQMERSRLSQTDIHNAAHAPPDALVEVQQLWEEADAAVTVGSALSTDIGKAADIAAQLNAWFLENAAKMRTQDSWASPSAYLETTTASLKHQMEGLSMSLSQLQAVFNSEIVEQASVPRRQSGSGGSEASVARPHGGNSATPVAIPRQIPSTANHNSVDSASSAAATLTSGALLVNNGSILAGGASVQQQQPHGQHTAVSGVPMAAPVSSSVAAAVGSASHHSGLTPRSALSAANRGTALERNPPLAVAVPSRGASVRVSSENARPGEHQAVRFSTDRPPARPTDASAGHINGEARNAPLSPGSRDDDLSSLGGSPVGASPQGQPSYTSFHISKVS